MLRTFKDVNMPVHVSSRVKWTLVLACILYKWSLVCMVYCQVLYRVEEDSTFMSSPGGLEASVKVAVA